MNHGNGLRRLRMVKTAAPLPPDKDRRAD